MNDTNCTILKRIPSQSQYFFILKSTCLLLTSHQLRAQLDWFYLWKKTKPISLSEPGIPQRQTPGSPCIRTRHFLLSPIFSPSIAQLHSSLQVNWDKRGEEYIIWRGLLTTSRMDGGVSSGESIRVKVYSPTSNLLNSRSFDFFRWKNVSRGCFCRIICELVDFSEFYWVSLTVLLQFLRNLLCLIRQCFSEKNCAMYFSKSSNQVQTLDTIKSSTPGIRFWNMIKMSPNLAMAFFPVKVSIQTDCDNVNSWKDVSWPKVIKMECVGPLFFSRWCCPMFFLIN